LAAIIGVLPHSYVAGGVQAGYVLLVVPLAQFLTRGKNMGNWNNNDIKKQFVRAQSKGWIAAFKKAGTDYDFPPELLMGIASRETNMNNIIGDSGHGYGLCRSTTVAFRIGAIQERGRTRLPELARVPLFSMESVSKFGPARGRSSVSAAIHSSESRS